MCGLLLIACRFFVADACSVCNNLCKSGQYKSAAENDKNNVPDPHCSIAACNSFVRFFQYLAVPVIFPAKRIIFLINHGCFFSFEFNNSKISSGSSLFHLSFEYNIHLQFLLLDVFSTC